MEKGELKVGVMDTSDGFIAGRFEHGRVVDTDDRSTILQSSRQPARPQKPSAIASTSPATPPPPASTTPRPRSSPNNWTETSADSTAFRHRRGNALFVWGDGTKAIQNLQDISGLKTATRTSGPANERGQDPS
jgi:hypothetical protein